MKKQLFFSHDWQIDSEGRNNHARVYNLVKQLQNTYLTDRETEDKFLREAYERTKHEVNVSHVLIRIDENDNDTINVYNKLNALRGPFLNSSIDDFKNSHHEDEE